MKEFHNIYRGRRVFLVGNGPSLKETPLDLIADEYSFAMNRIALIYSETKWRPSFFICTTTNVELPDWRTDILRTVELGIPCFVWDELLTFFPKSENIYPIKCSHGPEVVDQAPDDWWSDDVSERVCKFGTSMLPALQIAAYMGFDPMHLLGCDLGFTGGEVSFVDRVLRRLKIQRRESSGNGKNDPNHFHGSYGTPGLPGEALNRNMMAAHNLANRRLGAKGVTVFNSTLGGTLEIYPRSDLTEITQD